MNAYLRLRCPRGISHHRRRRWHIKRGVDGYVRSTVRGHAGAFRTRSVGRRMGCFRTACREMVRDRMYYKPADLDISRGNDPRDGRGLVAEPSCCPLSVLYCCFATTKQGSSVISNARGQAALAWEGRAASPSVAGVAVGAMHVEVVAGTDPFRHRFCAVWKKRARLTARGMIYGGACSDLWCSD